MLYQWKDVSSLICDDGLILGLLHASLFLSTYRTCGDFDLGFTAQVTLSLCVSGLLGWPRSETTGGIKIKDQSQG